MKIGVLGTGVMGQNHIRVYSSLKKVDSVLVNDLNRATSRAVAERTGAVACDSAEDLLRRVDAVSICVPTPHHLIAAEAALEHETHMLIEKPACATSLEAHHLAEAVPDGLVAGVGHIERFNPIVKEIKKIVRKPLYVEARRKSSKKIRSLYVEEEDLTIEGDYMTQEVTVYRRPDAYESVNERYVQENVIEKVLVNRVEPLALELSTFVDCVLEGRPFPITLEEGTATLEVCERIASCFGHGRTHARQAAYAGPAWS